MMYNVGNLSPLNEAKRKNLEGIPEESKSKISKKEDLLDRYQLWDGEGIIGDRYELLEDKKSKIEHNLFYNLVHKTDSREIPLLKSKENKKKQPLFNIELYKRVDVLLVGFDEAESILKENDVGTYLIRPSTTQSGAVTISYNIYKTIFNRVFKKKTKIEASDSKKIVTHNIRLQYNGEINRYYFKKTTFASLDEAIRLLFEINLKLKEYKPVQRLVVETGLDDAYLNHAISFKEIFTKRSDTYLIDKSESKDLLFDQELGVYLYRPSKTRPGEVVVSYVNCSREGHKFVAHDRLPYDLKTGKFFYNPTSEGGLPLIDDETFESMKGGFDSLDEFIEIVNNCKDSELSLTPYTVE